MKNTDVYLKDEGDFLTMILNSDKAKEIINKQSKVVRDNFYASGIKMDFSKNHKGNIITFLISYGLSWNNF